MNKNFGGQQNFGSMNHNMGGGHLQSPAVADPHHSSPNQQSPSKKSKGTVQQGPIFPVTVKQILSASTIGDEFKIDGKDVHQVVIVGMIAETNPNTTHFAFKLDDGTSAAPLDISLWGGAESSDEQNPQMQYYVENLRRFTYVRVYGSLKSFNQKRNIYAFKAFPARFEQVALHMAEVLYAHLYNTHGALSHTVHNTQYIANNNNHTTTTTSTTSMGSRSDPVQIIKALLERSNEPMGLSLVDIMSNTNLAEDVALRALDFLSSEASVFSPDEGRYKLVVDN